MPLLRLLRAGALAGSACQGPANQGSLSAPPMHRCCGRSWARTGGPRWRSLTTSRWRRPPLDRQAVLRPGQARPGQLGSCWAGAATSPAPFLLASPAAQGGGEGHSATCFCGQPCSAGQARAAAPQSQGTQEPRAPRHRCHGLPPQVHGLVTHDGRRGAMKIQYPGVARSIESDVGGCCGGWLAAARAQMAGRWRTPARRRARSLTGGLVGLSTQPGGIGAEVPCLCCLSRLADNLMRLINVANILPKGLYVENAVKVGVLGWAWVG